jgi:hypothetical protein
MMADILGDWREELITVLPGELRIYTTTIPACDRRVCLMQDGVYRAEVAHRSMGYEQSPVTGYYLGVPPAESHNAPAARLSEAGDSAAFSKEAKRIARPGFWTGHRTGGMRTQ